MIGIRSESGYDTTNFHYEIFTPACSLGGFLFGLMRRGAATTDDAASSGADLRFDPTARISAAAATV